MVIKILKGSKNFAGVNYNQEKVEEGKAQLLAMENMYFPDQDYKSAQELKAYLKIHSSKNKKVSKPQFHATISAKGKTTPKEELKIYAKDYMEHMGYGKQPYLIYFHDDTENNHVHIVSSRIDSDGKYINDSFERIRSNEFRDKTMHIDREIEVENHIDQVKQYEFTSFKQASMLLELQGYTTREISDSIEIMKGGRSRGTISNSSLIITKPKQEDTKKLYELFKKYSEGIEVSLFNDLMKKDFGIELIYHYGKNKNIPYGYTVFDHKNLRAFKGSEIIPINAILKGKERKSKIDSIDKLLDTLINSNTTFNSLTASLKMGDFSLAKNGKIYLKDTNELIKIMSNQRLKLLYHNQRKEDFNATGIYSVSSLNALKTIFRQDPNTLWSGQLKSDIKTEVYREKILSYLDQGQESITNLFRDENWTLHNVNGREYILDNTNNILLDKLQDLHISRELKPSLQLSSVEHTPLNRTETNSNQLQLLNLFDLEPADELESNASRKKKRANKNLKR